MYEVCVAAATRSLIYYCYYIVVIIVIIMIIYLFFKSYCFSFSRPCSLYSQFHFQLLFTKSTPLTSGVHHIYQGSRCSQQARFI